MPISVMGPDDNRSKRNNCAIFLSLPPFGHYLRLQQFYNRWALKRIAADKRHRSIHEKSWNYRLDMLYILFKQ
ncbi:hypothetical protein IL59_0209345 [Brucella suis bv. 4 str. 40]|nr:hypothetical protein IL59_0209345 [Brucella suis bv. 4 str. 40]